MFNDLVDELLLTQLQRPAVVEDDEDGDGISDDKGKARIRKVCIYQNYLIYIQLTSI